MTSKIERWWEEQQQCLWNIRLNNIENDYGKLTNVIDYLNLDYLWVVLQTEMKLIVRPMLFAFPGQTQLLDF